MKSILCLCFASLCLQLHQAYGQAKYQISGNNRQPYICIPQVSAGSDTGRQGQKPFLYLMSGAQISELPVAGNYTEANGKICFQPLYPLAEGNSFVLRTAGYNDTIISIAAAKMAIPTGASTVKAIYPLTDTIPENILFFHVRFSQPMKEDRDAWKKVHIINDRGEKIPGTWRQRSYWLDSGRLLVLMIHPGRVKSGIHYTGPVFAIGKAYNIQVDSSMEDQYGRPLTASAHHRYVVTEEHHQKLLACSVPKTVKAGTKEAIEIKFCNGIDHAAACTGIFMYDAAGKSLTCTVQQYEEYTVRIQPDETWPKGKIQLELSGSLYDCAGNRLNRLFEMKKKNTYLKDQSSKRFNLNAE